MKNKEKEVKTKTIKPIKLHGPPTQLTGGKRVMLVTLADDVLAACSANGIRYK